MAYQCPHCNKQFALAEALEQHQKLAHPHQARGTPSMKPLWIIGGIIAALIIGYMAFSAFMPSQYDEFAQCIAASGAHFYGAFWCPHCEDQKTMFGTAQKYLPYVECSNPDRSQTAICATAGIEAYPTWIFSDGSRANELTLQQLSQRTNCPLP